MIHNIPNKGGHRMKNMHYYLQLAASAMQTELTPEERKNLNQFLRGNADLAD